MLCRTAYSGSICVVLVQVVAATLYSLRRQSLVWDRYFSPRTAPCPCRDRISNVLYTLLPARARYGGLGRGYDGTSAKWVTSSTPQSPPAGQIAYWRQAIWP
ncbi:hypothetical protein G9A89_000226 [Geosiphon pyriformis]|nr:hypothetical protein G9A89_000226 [Geosiphon pyriformis]